ncbi:hypothetical protein [Vreelandella maris]|uniref:Uncharacterized protein n=1 Tax=Vreelandella maris TaxID=2729617 RepID=A0A7Y6V984_9GAMM|nr:hypothetical protein [Halomonas maris]NVF14610.1 hypothetical protein [Halomonas maris]|tara:strand:- start:2592 stop:2741 length:150 start_codon:yes stop_codon:yes gene_type:complete
MKGDGRILIANIHRLELTLGNVPAKTLKGVGYRLRCEAVINYKLYIYPY